MDELRAHGRHQSVAFEARVADLTQKLTEAEQELGRLMRRQAAQAVQQQAQQPPPPPSAATADVQAMIKVRSARRPNEEATGSGLGAGVSAWSHGAWVSPRDHHTHLPVDPPSSATCALQPQRRAVGVCPQQACGVQLMSPAAPLRLCRHAARLPGGAQASARAGAGEARA